jgi:hypothetical protein
MVVRPLLHLMLIACVCAFGVFGDRQGMRRHIDDEQNTNVCTFTIRDSLRVHDVVYQPGQRILDFVDVQKAGLQGDGRLAQSMFDSGERIATAPCHEYSGACYKQKLMQAFWHMLRAHGECTHFFYVEADNTMCVRPSSLNEIVKKHPGRTLILTGIGASGWLMHRAWTKQFLVLYKSHTGSFVHCPDCVAATMPGWSTYHVYLVAHSVQGKSVEQGLTISREVPLNKHLPRCLEPHRDRWSRKDVWDYFDHSKCGGREVYPCNGA